MSTAPHHRRLGGWHVVAVIAAGVPCAVIMTFAVSAITAGVDEHACIWTMRGGLLVSAGLAALIPIAAGLAAWKPRQPRSPPFVETREVAVREPMS